VPATDLAKVLDGMASDDAGTSSRMTDEPPEKILETMDVRDPPTWRTLRYDERRPRHLAKEMAVVDEKARSRTRSGVFGNSRGKQNLYSVYVVNDTKFSPGPSRSRSCCSIRRISE